ncbi:MAG: hypothetical protein WCO56_22000 [Verrucomicrobiota bacterium]
MDVEIPPATWHDAAASLKIVVRLISQLSSASPATADLKRIEQMLIVAEKAQVRFHITCDMR